MATPTELDLQVTPAQLRLMDEGIGLMLKGKRLNGVDTSRPSNPVDGFLSPAQVKCLQALRTKIDKKRTELAAGTAKPSFQVEHNRDMIHLLRFALTNKTKDIVLLANRMMNRLNQHGHRHVAQEIQKTLVQHLPGYETSQKTGILSR